MYKGLMSRTGILALSIYRGGMCYEIHIIAKINYSAVCLLLLIIYISKKHTIFNLNIKVKQ